jgi:2-iminobutanoate/2-iminopropanoate deaminase
MKHNLLYARDTLFGVIVLALGIAVGTAAQKTTERRYIKAPANPSLQQLPFSEGVLVGDTLYIAGHIGIDPKTGNAPASIDAEIKKLFDAFEQTLTEGGMNMDDLVQVEVHCTDLSLYDKFNAAYRANFSKDFPARAFLGANQILRGGHFEMLGIAIKRR